ncbi:MAG TPA: HD domain-containing phosphohydrolase [Burkholderiaceae bacterium]
MSDVNPHYLDHVVKLSEISDIEASEDIVTGSGMKLLAKGTKIDARVRERLLQFRLTKPLENMMRVVGGTDPTAFHPMAEQLLARHALLRGICTTVQGFDPTAALKSLELGDHLRSLLSVYAGQGAAKLEHIVGVAVLTSALGGSMNANRDDAAALAVAALTHDVGELYIDPAFLARDVKLTSQQWKHVATHPIVGSHVLGAMPGAGPRIASVVMAHHERMDGFGYPQGLQGSSLPVAGQMLAVAEMLMGLLESGSHHAQRAAVAMRLVPGEFNRRLIDRVMQGARAEGADLESDPAAPDIGALATRIAGLAATVTHARRRHLELDKQMPRFGAPLRALVAHAFTRWERIGIAFSSTGLDLVSDDRLQAVLSAMDAPELNEVGIVLRELEWRIAELERTLQIRSEVFGPADAQRVRELIEEARHPMLQASMAAAAAA